MCSHLRPNVHPSCIISKKKCLFEKDVYDMRIEKNERERERKRERMLE